MIKDFAEILLHKVFFYGLFVKSCGFDIKSKLKNDFNQDNSQIDFWELF